MDLVQQTQQISKDFPPDSLVSLDKVSIHKGQVGKVVGYRIVRLQGKPAEMRISVDVPGDHWVCSPKELELINE